MLRSSLAPLLCGLLLLRQCGAARPMPGSAPPQSLSTASALTLCACLLLAPLAAFVLRALWEDPQVPLLARLLWARAKALVGVRVSDRRLEAELVGVAKRYAPAAKRA